MSRFRDRCAELRARVIAQGTLGSVAGRREMPAQANLQSHVRGDCRCDSELPTLEYIGVGSGGHWEFSTEPPCRTCETDLLVERSSGTDHTRYKCHGCGEQFDKDAYVQQWLRDRGVQPTAARQEVDA